MPGWHPPLHAMRHPVSHLVAQSDLELRDEGAAHLAVAKAQLAGDHVSDASDALNAAFEDFEEVHNRNVENWHRGPVVTVDAVADGLAEIFYLKGCVAEMAQGGVVDRLDQGWARVFFQRALDQASRKQRHYQEALLAPAAIGAVLRSPTE
jgi:hypothetical protein